MDGNTKSQAGSSNSVIKSIQNSMVSLKSFTSNRSKVAPMTFPSQADIVYGIDGEYVPPDMERTGSSSVSIRTSDSIIEIESGGRGCLCWKKFISTMRKCWATRQTEDFNENLELFAKTTLRELFLYVLFLILLMIIAFGMSTPNIYYYTTAIKEVYGGSEFEGIANAADFWKYVENTLLTELYPDNWYNQRPNISQNYIYFENILLGIPQIRQLKVINNSCIIPKAIENIIPSCYGIYTNNEGNKSKFGLGQGKAWEYTTEIEDSEATTYKGNFGSYNKGGFLQTFGRNVTETKAIIDELKSNLWIDRGTRIVMIDFSVYNPNINFFCVVKLVVEFPSTSGAFPKAEIRTVKLIRYHSTYDYFVMCCEILYLVFIVYYIIEEVLEIKRNKFSYFKEVWNVLDVFVLVVSLICAVFNIYRVVYIDSQLESLLKSQENYVDFDFISYWHKVFNEAMAITVFFAIVKIFKYISFNKRMSQLTDTLGNSMKDLAGFAIMFFIVFFAFAQSGFLIFGSQVEDFREFDHSVFSLFRVILGDFQFYRLYDANNVLGPVFFFLYVFFVFFILINMFLAIINDSYALVQENLANTNPNDEFKVGTYLQQQIISRLRKDKIVKIQEVLQQADIMNKDQLSFQDWRNELQQHGYADVEIQALFLQYDHDHDLMLDYEERTQMLQDVKERKLKIGDNCDPSIKESGAPVVEEEEANSDEQVSVGQVRELVDRIDKVEVGIVEVVQKIDLILARLGDIEQAKLDYQKNVSYSLDILSGSQSSLRF